MNRVYFTPCSSSRGLSASASNSLRRTDFETSAVEPPRATDPIVWELAAHAS